MSDKQLNLFTSGFEVLISESKDDNDYINATKWCKHFNKKVSTFRAENKTFIRHLDKRLNETTNTLKPSHSNGCNKTKSSYAYGKGRYSETFVHPLLAIRLAEWLSPEFEIYVKETFKRYVEGDITIADDVIQRNNSQQDLDWLQTRPEGKQARKAFTDELKKRGVKGIGYAQNTNAVYTGLFDKLSKEKGQKSLPFKTEGKGRGSTLSLRR